VEGLGFAIPSATVKDIVSQIIENGYVSGRPTLDLSCESLSMFYRYYYGLPEGMYVTEVTPGGAAAKLGITTGDIILELDGVQTTSMEALNSALYAHEAGDKVDIIISHLDFSGNRNLVPCPACEMPGILSQVNRIERCRECKGSSLLLFCFRRQILSQCFRNVLTLIICE
jgi:membrane-associated protease RseP (regulator of RpoE activity)